MDSNQSETPKAAPVDIAQRRLAHVWTWVGVVVLVAVAGYLAGILSNVVSIIVWTVIFVFILRDLVNWLDKKGLNRTLGTIIAYIVFAVVLGFLLFIVFSPSVGISAQFNQLIADVPAYAVAFQDWVNALYQQYADVLQNEQVQQWVSRSLSSFSSWLQTFASASASTVVAAGGVVANTAMCIGFALVIAFWMLVDLPKLGREAYRLVGDKRRADAEVIHLTVTRVMGGYLKAMIIQCAIIGVGCGILYALLGVPSPAALGTITGLLNIIPIVGPWLGGGLAFVTSVVASPLVGVISLVGTVVIQQVVYTFISPKIMGESVDIHPALTFLALMAGAGAGAAMGGLTGSLVGALLSIPLVAMFKSLFVYYFEKRTGRRIVAEDGVFFKGLPHEGGEFDPVADATLPVPVADAGTTGRIPVLSDITDKLPFASSDDASIDSSGEDGSGDTNN